MSVEVRAESPLTKIRGKNAQIFLFISRSEVKESQGKAENYFSHEKIVDEVLFCDRIKK
jgi:hypothetical protein